MSPKVKPGDRVILGIRNKEVYEGTVECISRHSVELCDVYFQTRDVRYEGNMTFYRNEVESLSHITPSSPSESSSNGIPFDTKRKIKMHPDEFARLKEMYLRFNFIDVYDTGFRQAVEVLRNRESVAVVGLGNNFQRANPLSLLLVADFKQVYIFDMYCLVELRGLQDILESEFITKVVHNGAALFYCLYHKYGVEMKNVFDTQVVDTMLEKKENNRNVERDISECLSHHFNFPLALLSAAVDDIKSKIWQERPVTKSSKSKAAQLVTYLLTLRDHLLKKILQEYNKTIQETYDQYKQIDDTDFLKKI